MVTLLTVVCDKKKNLQSYFMSYFCIKGNRIMKFVSKKVQPHKKPLKTMFLHYFIGTGSGVCLKFDNMELNLITLYASNK